MAKGGKGYSAGRSSGFSLGKSSSSFSSSTPSPKYYSTSITPSSGGFLSSMADGFSFGVGSSIARNMVDRIFSSSLADQRSTGGSRES